MATNLNEAIHALETAIARIGELEKGLEPFAAMAGQVEEWQKGTDPNFAGHFSTADLFRARALLAARKPAQHEPEQE